VLKSSYHNQPTNNENKDLKNITVHNHLDHKKNVDVNILLNRVKLEKKNEKKKQIIFYSSTVLMLFAFIFIVFG
jgi:hypothetical protein|tara:strand:+ start:387 stop:608 length:222 start_codon:yes stop_codon:yes gene_type:complete